MGTRYAIHGQLSPGASVTVREDDGATLATIYEAISGGVPVSGSVIVAGDSGRVVIYIDEDYYAFGTRFSMLVELYGYSDVEVDDVTFFFNVVSTTSVVSSASALDVCNRALVMIGQPELVSLDSDTTARATACRRLYPAIRDAVLRAYGWGCAMEYATLTVDATAPAWGYAYRFPLPTDCLRLLALDSATYKHKVVGRYIYTNDVSDDLNIRYTKQLTDPAYWDTLLTQAVATRLSSALCVPLTGDLKKADFQFKVYQLAIREARSIDGQESYDDPIESTEFTTDVR